MNGELIRNTVLQGQSWQKGSDVIGNGGVLCLGCTEGSVVEVVSIMLGDAALGVKVGVAGVEGGDHGCFFGGGDEVVDEGESEVRPAMDFCVVGVDYGLRR